LPPRAAAVWGYIRASRVLGIHPRDMAALAGRGRGPAESRRNIMRILGYVVVIEMVGLGAVLGVLAVKGLPDARRYIEMRKM
jgi:hypothetical protein